jgi:hypothetical protein
MVAAITGRMNLLNTTLATFSLGPYSNANWNRTTSRLYGRLGSICTFGCTKFRGRHPHTPPPPEKGTGCEAEGWLGSAEPVTAHPSTALPQSGHRATPSPSEFLAHTRHHPDEVLAKGRVQPTHKSGTFEDLRWANVCEWGSTSIHVIALSRPTKVSWAGRAGANRVGVGRIGSLIQCSPQSPARRPIASCPFSLGHCEHVSV